MAVKWVDKQYDKVYAVEGLGTVTVAVTGQVPEIYDVTDLGQAITDLSAVLQYGLAADAIKRGESIVSKGKGKNKRPMDVASALVRCFTDGLEPKLRAETIVSALNSEETKKKLELLEVIEAGIESFTSAGCTIDEVMALPNWRRNCKEAGFDVSKWEPKA